MSLSYSNKKFSSVLYIHQCVNKRSVNMSSSFSTITPLNTSTISKMPAYASNNQPQAQQPAASNPLDAYSAPKKKSHWFLKTIATLAVLTAAVGLGRKFLPNVFDSAATVAKDANIFKKGLEYTKLGIAKAGDFVNKYAEMAYKWVLEIPAKFKGTGSTGTTGTPTP